MFFDEDWDKANLWAMAEKLTHIQSKNWMRIETTFSFVQGAAIRSAHIQFNNWMRIETTMVFTLAEVRELTSNLTIGWGLKRLQISISWKYIYTYIQSNNRMRIEMRLSMIILLTNFSYNHIIVCGLKPGLLEQSEGE